MTKVIKVNARFIRQQHHVSKLFIKRFLTSSFFIWTFSSHIWLLAALSLCIILSSYFFILLLSIIIHQLCLFHRVKLINNFSRQIQWTTTRLFYYLNFLQAVRVSIKLIINRFLLLIFFTQTNNNICKKLLILLLEISQLYSSNNWHIFVEHLLLIRNFSNNDNRLLLTKVSETRYKLNSRILNESKRMRFKLLLYENVMIN